MSDLGSLERLCAGAVLFDDAGRLLLVRRGRAPERGAWSIPGGKCRPGETTADACVREVAEETGLQVSVTRLAGTVTRPAPAGVYVIDDFVCALAGGTLRAGDDAAEVRWVSRAELDAVETVTGLVNTLSTWDLLPD